MLERPSPSRVIASADLREFFQRSVDDTLNRQGVDATVETVYYIVNLLTGFQRADRLFDFNGDRMEIRPLAMRYADALECSNDEEVNRIMQRMGDVTLFIAGFFAESLGRKLVDVDYYIAMGSNAYGYLSESMRGTRRAGVFCDIFEELSVKFTRFVDVLSDLNDNTAFGNHADILHLYETWLRTGSKHALNRLRRYGIEPSAEGGSALGRSDH